MKTTRIIELSPPEEAHSLVGRSITIKGDSQEYTVLDVVASGALLACVRLEPHFPQVDAARAQGAVVTFGETAMGIKQVYVGATLWGRGFTWGAAIAEAFPGGGESTQ